MNSEHYMRLYLLLLGLSLALSFIYPETTKENIIIVSIPLVAALGIILRIHTASNKHVRYGY